MAAETVQYGATKRVTATARNATGDLADPTTLSFVVTQPDGTETTYTYADGQLTKSSTGVFYRDILFDQGGLWVIRQAATGAVAQVDLEYVRVRDSAFG